MNAIILLILLGSSAPMQARLENVADYAEAAAFAGCVRKAPHRVEDCKAEAHDRATDITRGVAAKLGVQLRMTPGSDSLECTGACPVLSNVEIIARMSAKGGAK